MTNKPDSEAVLTCSYSANMDIYNPNAFSFQNDQELCERAKNMQRDVLTKYLESGWVQEFYCKTVIQLASTNSQQPLPHIYINNRIMDVEEKYCNIYDLDTSASAQSYAKKLQELNIFLSGKCMIDFGFDSNSQSIEKEIENYKAAFHEHDEDGSGNISTAGLLI